MRSTKSNDLLLTASLAVLGFSVAANMGSYMYKSVRIQYMDTLWLGALIILTVTQ